MKKVLLLIFLIPTFAQAQYPPAAGLLGSTAMYKDSSAFTGWASQCNLVRGYQDISNHSLGRASVGDSSMATGVAGSNGVVSLGDAGMATLTFSDYITNGPGPDFAVFENGFDDNFLELAFVEVSSNGIDFVRFPAVSLTQTSAQVASFDSLETTKLNNLAGKYRAQYGTPFNLDELAGTHGLDVNHISHVRVVDVVGSIDDTYATKDSQGNKVNDPWPTGFPSSGFDLDAVGVIHKTPMSIADKNMDIDVLVYPSLANSISDIHIMFKSVTTVELVITDMSGAAVYLAQTQSETVIIPASTLNAGFYLLTIKALESQRVIKLIVN